MIPTAITKRTIADAQAAIFVDRDSMGGDRGGIGAKVGAGVREVGRVGREGGAGGGGGAGRVGVAGAGAGVGAGAPAEGGDGRTGVSVVIGAGIGAGLFRLKKRRKDLVHSHGRMLKRYQ